MKRRRWHGGLWLRSALMGAAASALVACSSPVDAPAPGGASEAVPPPAPPASAPVDNAAPTGIAQKAEKAASGARIEELALERTQAAIPPVPPSEASASLRPAAASTTTPDSASPINFRAHIEPLGSADSSSGILAPAPSGGLGAKGTGQGGGGTLAGLGDMGGMGSGRGGLGARSSRHLLGAHGKLNELNGIHPGHDPLSTGDAFELPAPNGWTMAERDPLSTFAVDVDTASYTHVRRQLRDGHVVEPQAVRVEEMVNYFRYDYPAPTQDDFAVHLEAAQSPFEPGLKLLRVGLKAREPAEKDRKPIHLTFLVDVSGSMQGTDRLPLAKRSLRFLVDSLKPSDTVALCTYAGRVQRVLGPTPARERDRIHAGIEGLSAGGSTAMSSGLELAYSLAWESRVDGEESREVVLSDGDANVGRTAHGDMLESIAYYSDRGVTLSTIGFGVGNYKGSRMEQLANKGNGNAYYIDSFDEARRIFGEKIAGTLRVMARDTKVQVEFDPASVAKYRLVGYENRDVADEDFRNDKVDAGEVGLGHEVTAVYEVDLREPSPGWAKVRLRWKSEAGGPATERVFPLDPAQDRAEFSQVSKSFARAVAVAALGENLRKSPFAESWTLQAGKRIAEASLDKERPDELELLELYGIATAELAHR